MKTPVTIDNIDQKVLNYVRHHALTKPGDCIVVAVSGGADSVCMLHILNELRLGLGIRLHVAHLDHGLRGTEGRADANYVKRLAGGLGLPVTIGKADVRAWKTKRRTSLEEAARDARYRFLARVSKKAGATAVAVGHTLDDHVETVLLHVIRGTALVGLRGLRPSTELTMTRNMHLRVIRPLLTISREETAAYCSKLSLGPRTDASNADRRYLRNRVRLELLPLLRQINPEIDRTIARLAEAATEAYYLVRTQTEAVWPTIATIRKESVTLKKAEMLSQPPAIRGELIRMAIVHLLGESRDFTARHFEAVINMLSSPAGRTINLPHQIKVITHHDSLVLSMGTAEESPFPPLEKEVRIQIPGITTMAGWRVTATVTTTNQHTHKASLTAVFDMDTTGDDLTVTSRRPGDRFQPLGMSQPKKLQDFMVDAHIPRAWRDRIPLVKAQNDIIWVAGYRIGHRFRTTPTTKRFLTLTFRQTKPTSRHGLLSPASAKHSTPEAAEIQAFSARMVDGQVRHRRHDS